MCLVAAVLPFFVCLGCQSSGECQVGAHRSAIAHSDVVADSTDAETRSAHVRLVSLESDGTTSEPFPSSDEGAKPVSVNASFPVAESLSDLEALAFDNNPTLRRMQQEAAAAWDKARYVDKLPDPSVGSNFFVPPMNFEPDRQVVELQVMQMIPWLSRLEAEAQQACMEALAAENMYHAERLRVIGDLRANWFKLYVLGKQIETTVADQRQLESLIKTANARVATGDAQPGDVLMATLELSSLQEQLITYRQEVVSTAAELNRLIGRDADTPIDSPTEIASEFPNWDFAQLRQVASESQPELNAARLRTAASRWGVEVARLKRRPDLTFGVGWVVMDAPGATMPDAGRDSLTLSVSTTLPIWREKYDAMSSEASRQHIAAHASEDEVFARLDGTLRDLWEQARANHEKVELYERSILPQARQTFEANQKSLVNNSVSFDRVVRDYRTLLNLELGYHRALGQQATTLARICQTVGADLTPNPSSPPPGP